MPVPEVSRTMPDSITHSKRPLSVIGATDYSTLVEIAGTAISKNFDVAAELVEKLQHACVLADGQVSPDTVQIGSEVTFDVEGACRRTITLVCPDEVDADAARISVLTPVGVALLGLRPGHRSAWFSRDGRSNALAVVRVGEDRMAAVALSALS